MRLWQHLLSELLSQSELLTEYTGIWTKWQSFGELLS